MNFLGHFILSYPDKYLLTGNFIADNIKGKAYLDYPPAIAKGIMMHRTIDDITDHDPASKICLDMLRPVAGKYAGVALDILYDYEIAQNWKQYSTKTLADFATEVYLVLSGMSDYFSDSDKRLFEHMSGENWLLTYSTKEGIQRTLKNMSKRVGHANNLDKLFPGFEDYETDFAKQFEVFFKHIQAEINKQYK